MVLAGGDLGVASTRGGGFVLAGRFCGLASTRGGGLVLAGFIGLVGASAEASESIFFLNLS